jgi:hypothetical protein
MPSSPESLTIKRIALLIAVAAVGFAIAFATGLGVKRDRNSPAGGSSAPLVSSPEAPKVVGLGLREALPDLRRTTSTEDTSTGTSTGPPAGRSTGPQARTTTTPPSTTGTNPTTTPRPTQTTPSPKTTDGYEGGGAGGGG